MTLEVYGAYALPESWKAKIVSYKNLFKFNLNHSKLQEEGADLSAVYEIECCGLLVQDGKVIPRELTEEEKAEADAGGKGGAKGKPPAKDAKKGAKEEEPTPEELEKMEQERLEREEKEKKLAEEWDKLDEETKHIRKNEDIFKEPCVKMQNLIVIEKVEKLQA